VQKQGRCTAGVCDLRLDAEHRKNGTVGMISDNLYNRFYDDPKLDGTLTFYAWIEQHLGPDSLVLNLGAGGHLEEPADLGVIAMRRLAAA
jgi:hypothetical protein